MGDYTVLLLDSARYIVQIVSFNLRKKGFKVRKASSGKSALEKLSREKIDLVIMDVLLPGENGFEICRKIKEAPETCGIPVIILTAKGQDFDRARGIQVGAACYMTKPFSPRKLVEKVGEILGLNTGEKEFKS